MCHDYTAIRPEHDKEALPRLGTPGIATAIPEAVTAALNPPRTLPTTALMCATTPPTMAKFSEVAAGDQTRRRESGNGRAIRQKMSRKVVKGPSNWRGREPPKKEIRCYYCNKRNHMERECWKKHPQLKVAWDRKHQERKGGRAEKSSPTIVNEERNGELASMIATIKETPNLRAGFLLRRKRALMGEEMEEDSTNKIGWSAPEVANLFSRNPEDLSHDPWTIAPSKRKTREHSCYVPE